MRKNAVWEANPMIDAVGHTAPRCGDPLYDTEYSDPSW